MPEPQADDAYDAVLFDLLTAVLDSWTLWNAVAGGQSIGTRWRGEYLHLTYCRGAYEPYEEVVAQAAENVGLPRAEPRSRRLTKATVWSLKSTGN